MDQPAQTPEPSSLLLVDDDDLVRRTLAQVLARRGFSVTAVSNGAAALEQARNSPPRFAVLDLSMPGMNGIELLRELRTISPATRVLILTGYGSIATAIEATRLGAVEYLTKPADPNTVVKALFGGNPVDHVDTDETPTFAEAEWEHIKRVLGDCDGNLTRAAEKLDVNRRTLHRKLRRRPPG
ncbi:MAG: response regulator [Deltaproteobacteria bacterium]